MPVMSAADRARWEAVQQWKADRLAPPVVSGSWWSRGSGLVVEAVGTALGQVPGASGVGRVVVGGLERLIDLGTGTAAASVRTGPVVGSYRARGLPVDDLAQVRELPLTDIRAVMPNLGVSYAVGGAVQSVGSSVLTSGGTVLTVAGAVGTAGLAAAPGIGALLAAITLDAACSVLVSTRAVAHVAAYHGFDVADPQERLFALGVLSLGLAEDTRRAAAYRELTGIARGLARQEAWRLTTAQAGAVVRAVSTSLALRLTQERFAQVVPVVGTVLGVRRSVRGLVQVVDDAEHLYAERLLRERYALPLDDAAPGERGEIAQTLDDALAAV